MLYDQTISKFWAKVFYQNDYLLLKRNFSWDELKKKSRRLVVHVVISLYKAERNEQLLSSFLSYRIDIVVYLFVLLSYQTYVKYENIRELTIEKKILLTMNIMKKYTRNI